MEGTETTKLPARLVATTKAVKVTPEYKAQLEQALLPYFKKLEDWDTRIEEFKSKAQENGISDDDIHKAGEGRKVIQQTRLAAVRVIDKARKIIQDEMADHKNADTLWLRAKQNVEADCKAFEAELKEIEETRIREEARKRAELKELRTEQIALFCDNPAIYPLGDMSEGDFLNLKAVLAEQYKNIQEAQAKLARLEELEKMEAELEAERLRQDNEKLQRKQARIRRIVQAGASYGTEGFIWPGHQFVLLEDTIAQQTDEEFENLLAGIKLDISDHNKKQAERDAFNEKRWRERTGQLLGDLIWRGPINASGYIFDLLDEKILAHYSDVITLDDEAYGKIMTPYIKRETDRREQEIIAAQEQRRLDDAAEAHQQRTKARQQLLFDLGLTFDGVNYVYKDLSLSHTSVNILPDAKFNDELQFLSDNIAKSKLAEAEAKMDEIEEIDSAVFEDPIVTAIPVTGSMKSRLTAWLETLKFPEPPGEYTGKGLKEVKNMRDGFETWRQFCEERIKKL